MGLPPRDRARRAAVRLASAMSLALVAVAGCGAHGGSSAGWPRSAGAVVSGDAADDGGESLAPRVSTSVAAIEAAEDPPAAAVVVDKPADKPAAAVEAKPAAVTPPASEEPIMTEDIVIEIKD